MLNLFQYLSSLYETLKQVQGGHFLNLPKFSNSIKKLEPFGEGFEKIFHNNNCKQVGFHLTNGYRRGEFFPFLNFYSKIS